MNADCLKLTTYSGETDRTERGSLVARLLDLYTEHEVAVSIVFRGTEGFGRPHHLHTRDVATSRPSRSSSAHRSRSPDHSRSSTSSPANRALSQARSSPRCTLDRTQPRSRRRGNVTCDSAEITRTTLQPSYRWIVPWRFVHPVSDPPVKRAYGRADGDPCISGVIALCGSRSISPRS